MLKLNQIGASQILLLLAAIGIIILIFVTNTFSFKDNLLSKLFPKPPSQALSPYKIGAYYFGMWSSTDTIPNLLDSAEIVYGRRDMWAGVKDFYGLEPGIPQDTRGWSGDFSYRKPEIGYYDFSLSGPIVLEQHINQAKQNGLSFFNFYWYWDSTYKTEFLKDGIDSFLQASNRDLLQFMVTIVSHPWCNGSKCLFIPAEDGPITTQTIVNKYLTQPNYLKTQSGRPIVYIHDSRGIKGGTLSDLQDFIALLKVTSRNSSLGLEPFVLVNVENPDAKSVINADGYSCINTLIQPAGAQSYQFYLNNFVNNFNQFTDKPLMPCFVSNFDERPEQDILIPDRNQIRYFDDFSETLFRDGVTRVKQYMDSQTNELSKILTVYAWNEWHEGGIIEPNVRDHNKWLTIIAQTFNLETQSPTPTPSPSPTPTPSPSPTPPPKVGDINGDGSVNVVDFSIMLSKWGTSDPASDLNGDGTVNVVDFSVLLSKWGT